MLVRRLSYCFPTCWEGLDDERAAACAEALTGESWNLGAIERAGSLAPSTTAARRPSTRSAGS